MEKTNLYEKISDHDFFRGVRLTISLAELAEKFEQSELSTKYLCFVICELCETRKFMLDDFDVGAVSDQFRAQWMSKILNLPDTMGAYMHSWNMHSALCFDNFVQQTNWRYSKCSITAYRQWIFEQVVEKFGDVQFTFDVMVDGRED